MVSVVKPQSAFYERFGSRGIAVLERVIAESRDAGALVLLDVKRGDIGSTAQAYADAYLDPASPLGSDAITASPYLGFGSLDPMVEACRRHGGGLFVLALTSNKEGPEVQHARRRRSAPWPGPCSTTCAGSTRAPSRWAPSARSSAPPSVRPTRTSTSTVPFLAPGYGAQGGTVADLLPDLRRLGEVGAAQLLARGPGAPDPTSPRCATPHGAATTPCEALGA